MKLVEFLVSGVAGAEDGTATFVLRGTASSAASVLYSDFEGTTQPGTNIITLDSNGAAEVYCDAYCDVTLKTEAGATIRTVTVGNAGTTVEVISDSFTGTDYSGAPTAVSEPITLTALLNKWNDSAGASDWKVDVDGVATNLSSAVAGFTGMFVNVKDPAYGAVGDGVTDDTTAISNAIGAADGGIVFFPPGTYKVTAVNGLSEANFHLMGSGAGISIITSNTINADILAVTNNTTTGIKIVQGLGFAATAAIRYHALLEDGQNVWFRDCVFDCTNAEYAVSHNSGSVDAVYTFDNCRFILGASTLGAVLAGISTESISYIFNTCTFSVASGFAGDILSGSHMHASNCIFDASAVTSGTYYHVDAESNNLNGVYTGTFIGNKFYDGGSSGFAFDFSNLSANSNFREDNNMFVGFTDPTAHTDAGHIYDFPASTGASHTGNNIILGSRRGKTLYFTLTDSTNDLIASIVAENMVLTTARAASTSFSISDFGYEGMKTSVIVFNTDASARDITANGGTAFPHSQNVPSGGLGQWQLMSVREVTGTLRTIVMSSEQTAA
jgi:hypothetical protein